jgi:hypothetical protein
MFPADAFARETSTMAPMHDLFLPAALRLRPTGRDGALLPHTASA